MMLFWLSFRNMEYLSTWAMQWHHITQGSTQFIFSCMQLGRRSGVFRSPALKSIRIWNLHDTERASFTIASWWACIVVCIEGSQYLHVEWRQKSNFQKTHLHEYHKSLAHHDGHTLIHCLAIDLLLKLWGSFGKFETSSKCWKQVSCRSSPAVSGFVYGPYTSGEFL